MFTIGEFSRITGLSLKTIRFYHEKEILIPCRVDAGTGYRYYDHNNVERARIITCFRNMEFTINEIKTILENYDDQADILEYLEQHRKIIEGKMRKHKNILVSLDRIISNEREAVMAMKNSSFGVEEKSLDSIKIAGVRMKGKYSDCGKGFARIGKSFGRYICGKPLCLYYDNEYRPEDADFEACMPVSVEKEVEGILVRQLPSGQCVSLLHKGPYDELGRSYAKILEYVNVKGYEIVMPTREVYIKGPGMIFKGNPKKYLTEIQFLIKK